jgi:hypothetical protein
VIDTGPTIYFSSFALSSRFRKLFSHTVKGHPPKVGHDPITSIARIEYPMTTILPGTAPGYQNNIIDNESETATKEKKSKV